LHDALDIRFRRCDSAFRLFLERIYDVDRLIEFNRVPRFQVGARFGVFECTGEGAKD